MEDVTTTTELVTRIEEHCRRTKTAETTFGLLTVNDGKLVGRLRGGKSITLDTLDKIERALSGTPPTHANGEAA